MVRAALDRRNADPAIRCDRRSSDTECVCPLVSLEGLVSLESLVSLSCLSGLSGLSSLSSPAREASLSGYSTNNQTSSLRELDSIDSIDPIDPIDTIDSLDSQDSLDPRDSLRDIRIRYRTIAGRTELLDQRSGGRALHEPCRARRAEHCRVMLAVAVVVARCDDVRRHSERDGVVAEVLASQHEPVAG